MITAEFDPLRDEGEAYAGRLEAAGVAVELSCYEGLIHGCIRMPGVIPTANSMLDEAASALGAAFASG